MCVCIGSQYLQKILEKHCKNLASLDFANFFLEIFANISILYTHIFSVAKAFTQTKLHSSENKVPSSILHLIVENTIVTGGGQSEFNGFVGCINHFYIMDVLMHLSSKEVTQKSQKGSFINHVDS